MVEQWSGKVLLKKHPWLRAGGWWGAGGGEGGRGRGVSIWTSPERRRRTVRRSSCLGV